MPLDECHIAVVGAGMGGMTFDGISLTGILAVLLA
jgi:uncharacterized membrane protein